MKIKHLLLISLGGMFLSSCVYVGTMEIKTPPDINMQIVQNSGVMKITTTGSGKCKVENQGNGCIHIDAGDMGLIVFKLSAQPVWSLKEIEICKGSTNENKDCNLNVWERMEFSATDDSGSKILLPNANGVIHLKSLSEDLVKFILLDQNTIKQEYYYRVQACNSDTGDCLWADPPIENGGMGGRGGGNL